MTYDVDADITRAWTLPSAFYRDEAAQERVRERVLARSWQYLAHTDEIRQPGHVLPVTFLEGSVDEPLLLTRGDDDALHLLSNVCTHRANLVAAEPGRCRGLRCPYHGRRFDLDGCFRSMPEFDAVQNFPSPSDDLRQLPMEVFGNLIFGAIDPICPFDELLAEVRRRTGFLQTRDLVHDPSRSRDYLVQAHWALYCDNFLEGFHIPFVHTALDEVIDYGAYETITYPWGCLQLGVARGDEHVFALPDDSPEHGRDIAAYWFWVFPNLMLNFYPWGLSVNVVRPLAANRTRVSFLTFVGDPSRLDDGAGAALDRVEREDEVVVEAVQRGLRSRIYDRGRFSPTREQGVHHFQRMLASLISAD